MARLPRSLAFLLIILGWPSSGICQTTASVPASAPGDGKVAEWMYGEHIPSIPGLPFSARVELETVNQLQDGTLITHKTYNLDARDSEGRTRNEARNWIDPTTNAEPRLVRIELYDPATKLRTNLFPLTKIANQWVVDRAGFGANASAQTTTPKPETSRENIGADTIEGLPVRGTRVSQTYGPGSLGNDRQLIIVTEYWYSEELKINLLTKRTDPRYGVQTVRVTELVRQEPDAALFDISDEYKVSKPAETGAHAQASEEQEGGTSTGTADAASFAKTGVVRAGVRGITVPACIYCPSPSYTSEARAAKVQGSVVLRVTVTADGQVADISVTRALGSGLEQNAIEAVRNWRFRPAAGPDGKPVASIVPIEVTFRLK